MKSRLVFLSQIFICTIFVTGGWLLLPQPANAGYLDPGSGSILVQSIIAVLAAAAKFINKVKGFFGFPPSADVSDDDRE